jgi:hypothetical protein
MRVQRLIRNAAIALLFATTGHASEPSKVLIGPPAMGDWTTDAPGVRRKITVQDLPPPSSNLLSINPPRQVRQPEGARHDRKAHGRIGSLLFSEDANGTIWRVSVRE